VGDTRPRRRTSEPQAPPWERQRRYEAYPTLRTRIGLPALPRVGLLAIALLLAALGLFFLPTLLGIGNPAGSPAPSGSAGRSAAPSASAAASISAVPTPQVYEVQPNDTMSKIAAKFGVPLADLVAANKDKIPNPDKLSIGDLVIIPAPPPSGFTDPRTAAPAASPTRPPATRTPTPTVRR
jgi:LysM repeat protein